MENGFSTLGIGGHGRQIRRNAHTRRLNERQWIAFCLRRGADRRLVSSGLGIHRWLVSTRGHVSEIHPGCLELGTDVDGRSLSDFGVVQSISIPEIDTQFIRVPPS